MLNELQAIVDDLAHRLKASTVLEDHDQRMVVYSSQSGPIDEVRRDSILQRETSQQVKEWFRQFGIAQATAPLRIPSHPELGILGRLCSPVRFRGRLMGFLFLIDDEQRLGEGDIAAAEQAGLHAGVLLYEEELSERLSASVLSHLLAPSAELRENAARQLLEQGLTTADAPHAVVYVRPADPSPVAGLAELIGEALSELGRHRGYVGLLRVARHDHGVLLARISSVDDDRAARAAAEEARGMLARRLPLQPAAPATRPRAASGGGEARVVAGIGDPQRHLTAAVVSYRQALLAARVAVSVPSVGNLARWQDLGAFRALVQLPLGEQSASCLDPRLVTLLGAESGLAETVEAYLDLGGDAKRTAEQLNVHRATLYYRLGKAQRLTGADLHDGNDRLALHLSFKLARLTERYPPTPKPAPDPALAGAGGFAPDEAGSPVVPRSRSEL
ncbi:MAG TPA: helix-turn-helix domain-containing protein [Streptosporangiaceae bacterium]|nr:helix-turn-helix domain-containing protein [Streptosporangiaceae bacterium]